MGFQPYPFLNKRSQGAKKVFFYLCTWRVYCTSIFGKQILMSSLGKSQSEKCVAISNYYCTCIWHKRGIKKKEEFQLLNFFFIHPVLIFFFFLQNGNLYGIMIGRKTIWDIYIKKSSEKTQISKISHIWKVYRIFILHQILTGFFFFASFVLKHFSSMLGRFSPSLTVSWQTCDQIYLLSNFNAG